MGVRFGEWCLRDCPQNFMSNVRAEYLAELNSGRDVQQPLQQTAYEMRRVPPVKQIMMILLQN